MKSYRKLKLSRNPFLTRVAAVFLIIPLLVQMEWTAAKAEPADLVNGVSTAAHVYYGDTEIYDDMEIDPSGYIHVSYSFEATRSELANAEAAVILPDRLNAAYEINQQITGTDSDGNEIRVGELTVDEELNIKISFIDLLVEKGTDDGILIFANPEPGDDEDADGGLAASEDTESGDDGDTGGGLATPADTDSGAVPEDAESGGEQQYYIFQPQLNLVGTGGGTGNNEDANAAIDPDEVITVEFDVPVAIDTANLPENEDGSFDVTLVSGGKTVTVILLPAVQMDLGIAPLGLGNPYATQGSLARVARIFDCALTIDGKPVVNNASINVGNTALLNYSFNFQIDGGDAAVIKAAMLNNVSGRYSIDLPALFTMPPGPEFTQKMYVKVWNIDGTAEENLQYGTLHVDPNTNKAWIIFEGDFWTTSYVVLAIDNAKIEIKYNADMSGFSAGTLYSVTLANGTPVNFYINPPVAKPGIEKKGVSKGNGLIEWKVTYTPVATGATPYDITLKDTLGANQTYVPGSFKVDGSAQTPTVSPDGKTITYTHTITNPSPTTPIVFTYQTALSSEAYASNGNTAVSNQVEITNDAGIPMVRDNDTVTVPKKDKQWLIKERDTAADDPVNHSIGWEVTVSTNNLGDSIKNLTFKDTLSPGLQLVENSITITPGIRTGVVYDNSDGNSNTTSNTPGYDPSKKTTFSFEIATNAVTPVYAKTYTITYSTKVDYSYYNYSQDYSFNNKATVEVTFVGDTNPDPTYVGANVGPVPNRDIVQKKSLGYNGTNLNNRYITWEITVNEYLVDVQSGTITDTIPAGLEYDSCIISTSAITRDQSTPTPNPANGKAQTVTFNVASLGVTTATIGITTKVTDAALSKNGDQTGAHVGDLLFTNNVTFKGFVDGNYNMITSNASASQYVPSNVIKKEGALPVGGYDYNNKEITWKITVNENKIPMPNAALTDTLPSYLTYAGNLSLTVTNGGGALIENTDYVVTQLPSASNNNTLKIKFNGAAIDNKTVEVTFKTKVNAEMYLATIKNGNFQLKNDANLTWNNIPSGIHPDCTAVVEIPNNTVSKSSGSGYDPNTNEIKYSIAINPLEFKFVDCKLVDEIPKQLKLDIGSVHLYYAQVSATGAITHTSPKVEAQLGTAANQWNWGYDESVSTLYNKFTVELPNDSGKCYILEYTCLLMEVADSVYNKITFSGNSGTNSASDVTVNTIMASHEAIAQYKAGSISVNIKKVDSTRPEIPVKGIKFNLFTEVGVDRQFIESAVTDADGKLSFSVLSTQKNYWLVEDDAGFVNGYDTNSGIVVARGLEGDQKLSDDPTTTYMFTTGDRNGAVTTITITNDPTMRDIEFKKVRANNGVVVPNSYVNGARFTITEMNSANRNPFTAWTASATSSGSGIVKFENVPYPAKYELIETYAPQFYTKDSDVYTLSIAANRDYTITNRTTGEVYDSTASSNVLWEVKNDYHPPSNTKRRRRSSDPVTPTNLPLPMSTPVPTSMPLPNFTGNVIIPGDNVNVYIEIDKDGNPVGEWHWTQNDDEVWGWIFKQYSSPPNMTWSGRNNPYTGYNSHLPLWLSCFCAATILLAVLLWRKRIRKKRQWWEPDIPIKIDLK